MAWRFASRACLALALAVGGRASAAAQSPASTPAPEGAAQSSSSEIAFTWDEHPTLSFGEHVQIEGRARFQAGVTSSEATTAEIDNAADVERRRIGVEGRIGRLVTFQLEHELVGRSGWRDVYVDVRPSTAVRLQAGQFKLPFSLDENTGAGSQPFVYRSMAASALAPGRDQGAMLHGRVWGRVLSYEAGVFVHDGDNARVHDDGSLAGGQTRVVRLSTELGKRAGFHAGVAVASSDVPATIWTVRGRTALDATFYPAALWVQGARRRVGVEARWAAGPFSIQSEYIRLMQERLSQGVMNENLAPVTASGWYLSGTWAVTGARKGRKRRTQGQSVFAGGSGAVEVAARVEALTFGSLDASTGGSVSPRAAAVLGNRDRALTLGVNWYLSPHLRLQGNVIRDALADPTRGPLPARPSYWSSVIRLQVGI